MEGSSTVMIGGEGPKSYAQNSAYQGSVLDNDGIMKTIIEDEIYTKLDVNQFCSISTNCFYMADFGCATGHNSFRTMEIIIGAVKKKFQTQGLSSITPEFQVFFNDQTTNDFNTLFNALPPERNYYAAGVPGSFQSRLLPRSSLHFAHSSWSLQWLSEVPKEVADSTCAAWNKGKIHYDGARKEVFDAYLDQFTKDVGSYLEARDQELVKGGLMTLLLPGVPDYWDPETSYVITTGISILGSCFMDMVNEGKLCEAEIDTFNIPFFVPTPQQLKTVIQRNDSFTIERMELLNNPRITLPGWHTAKAISSFTRSAFEGVFKERFAIEIIDQAHDRFQKKLEASSISLENDKTIIIFLVLRRKE